MVKFQITPIYQSIFIFFIIINKIKLKNLKNDFWFITKLI